MSLDQPAPPSPVDLQGSETSRHHWPLLHTGMLTTHESGEGELDVKFIADLQSQLVLRIAVPSAPSMITKCVACWQKYARPQGRDHKALYGASPQHTRYTTRFAHWAPRRRDAAWRASRRHRLMPHCCIRNRARRQAHSRPPARYVQGTRATRAPQPASRRQARGLQVRGSGFGQPRHALRRVQL